MVGRRSADVSKEREGLLPAELGNVDALGAPPGVAGDDRGAGMAEEVQGRSLSVAVGGLFELAQLGIHQADAPWLAASPPIQPDRRASASALV